MAMRENLPDFWRGGWGPMREFNRLQRRMERLFNEFPVPSAFFEPGGPGSYEPQELGLACDIDETDTHYLISLDVPGVKKDDIRLEVKNNQLFISGERKSEEKHKEGRSFSQERYYGSFQRAFTLPSEVDPEKVEANYQNGVLEIAIPKAQPSKAKQIPVGEQKEGIFTRLLGGEKGKAA